MTDLRAVEPASSVTTSGKGSLSRVLSAAEMVKDDGEEEINDTRATATIRDSENNLEEGEEDNEVPALHTYAKQGDVEQIRALLESGETEASERDAQDITALHWAAMNMHIPACKELLKRGAEVDAVGGQLHATPLHWAARNGNLYVVHLLILHGADPALADSQGFTTLHLAVHSHNPMLLAYLLSQQLPLTIDNEDSAGQTALQWACYQGDQLSVTLLLKAGADPNKSDSSGLTAVHWAAVRGSVGCISKVVDAGGDCLKKDNSDMNPVDLARRQHSLPALQRAMESSGREIDGRRKKRTLSDRQTKIAIFVLPLLCSYLILQTLQILPWHTGMILAAAESFGMHHIITKVLLDAKPALGGTPGNDALQKSPYLVALLSSSIFWVGYDWLFKLVTKTTAFSYANFIFAASALLCAYNLFRAVTLDPGYIAKPASEVEVREVVEELTSQGRMNGQNFCLSCMVRQPLRSRHCRHCDRCVARFDHHCPWIFNCVGLHNHRQFICFILFLISGILTFDFLAYQYLSANSPSYDVTAMSSTCLFPSTICAAANYDVRTFSISLWATIQITWTTLVIASHLYQISRNITTFEVSNLGRYGHMGTRGLSASVQEGHMHVHAQPSTIANGGSPGANGAHVHGPHCKHGHPHSHSHSHNPLKLCAVVIGRLMPSTLLAIVGLDLYTKGRGAEGMVRAAEKGGVGNPFDVGIIRNCTDFWTRGKTLGVNYEATWDVPPEGYRSLIAARKRSLANQKEAQAVRKRGTGYEMLQTAEEV